MEVQASATKSVKGACKVFLQDLQDLPEEAFCKSFGGSARTVADIVYEVNLVNDHIGMVMRGEDAFVWPEGWIKAPAELDSKEKVIKAFEDSSSKIIETVEGYSEEDFEAPLKTEDGETNRFERCRFMALHMWYHSGQFNFIQTLLGDSEW